MDMQAYAKAYYQEHKEELKAKAKAYALEHKGQQAKWYQQYRAEHREEILEKKRLYRESHREELRQKANEYYDIHKEPPKPKKPKVPVNVRSAQRRARMKAVPNTLTPDEWRTILDQHEHSCAYCGAIDKKLTVDHVIPVSKGGGTTADNVVPACPTCNSRKGDRDWEPTQFIWV